MLAAVVLAFLVVFLVFLFLGKKYSYFAQHKILHEKPLWITGNLNGIGTKYQLADKFRMIYEKFKTRDVIVGFYMLFSPVLLIVDPSLAQRIIIKDFNSFVDRGVFHNEDKEMLTRNLFSISGKKWKTLRNKLSPAFTKSKLKVMLDVINCKGDNLVKGIEARSGPSSIEMKKLAIRFTIDSIISCFCGLDCNTLLSENEDILAISEKIFGSRGLGQLFIFFLFAFPETAKKLNVRQFDADIEDYFTSVISETLKHREVNSVRREDDVLSMLTQLMEVGKIDGEVSTETRKLDFKDVVAQIFILFFAGFETTATTISFTLAELAINENIQDKLRTEIHEVLRRNEGRISMESLREMKFLSQVIDESLRMHPPVPLLIRKANVDYEIPDSHHIVKNGQQVIIPLVAFHYDEKYWKDPEVFDPKRTEFSANKRNGSFLPFGDGPRNCIGGRLGLLMIKVAIVNVLSNFKLTLDNTRTKIPLKLNPRSPLTEIDGGDWIHFERIYEK